jgi:[ribosomal protein S5]-alanine N-acetyltransferase
MTAPTRLETARLLLREFCEADAEAFHELHRDPAVTRYTGDGPVTSVDHARDILLAHPIADYRKYGFGRWACVLKASGQLIGFAGLKYLDDLKEVDVGYRLAPAHWGAGLATEATRALIRYGFEKLGLKQILGLVDPENLASVRVLQKAGLTADGMIEFRGSIVARYVIKSADGRLSTGPETPPR